MPSTEEVPKGWKLIISMSGNQMTYREQAITGHMLGGNWTYAFEYEGMVATLLGDPWWHAAGWLSPRTRPQPTPTYPLTTEECPLCREEEAILVYKGGVLFDLEVVMEHYRHHWHLTRQLSEAKMHELGT